MDVVAHHDAECPILLMHLGRDTLKYMKGNTHGAPSALPSVVKVVHEEIVSWVVADGKVLAIVPSDEIDLGLAVET